MKLFSTTLLLMVITTFCFGQNPNYEFKGFLTTSEGQLMSFKLMMTEIKEGKFKGYSATNYEGSDYTKSIIEGELDLNEKKMSFKELSNTETTSDAEDSTFCYINASYLTIEISVDKNIIKGKFEGVFPSGQSCATGSLILVNEDNLEDIQRTNEPVPNKTISANIEVKDPTVSDSLFTSNEVLSINEWQEGLTIEVWDGNIQDNDEIAIYLNDELKREKVVLRHKKALIDLPPNESKFRVKIVALNEGLSGKNTLNFRLRNAGTDKEYISVLRKGESFIIDFRKE